MESSREEEGGAKSVTFWIRDGTLAGPCLVGSMRSRSILGERYLCSWVKTKKKKKKKKKGGVGWGGKGASLSVASACKVGGRGAGGAGAALSGRDYTRLQAAPGPCAGM